MFATTDNSNVADRSYRPLATNLRPAYGWAQDPAVKTFASEVKPTSGFANLAGVPLNARGGEGLGAGSLTIFSGSGYSTGTLKEGPSAFGRAIDFAQGGSGHFWTQSCTSAVVGA